MSGPAQQEGERHDLAAGAPTASIGGGTCDGVFLAGITAVLLASFL